MTTTHPPIEDKLRHQIGVYTEAVFIHSIALGNGKTHQEAADAIIQLVTSYAQKKYQEGELAGRISFIEETYPSLYADSKEQNYTQMNWVVREVLEGLKSQLEKEEQ